MKFLLFIQMFLALNCAFGQDRKEIENVVKFADAFRPTTYNKEDSNVIVPDIPLLDSIQRNNFFAAYRLDSNKVEACAFAVILKVYKAQLTCCKQSYDIFQNGCGKRNTISFIAARAISKGHKHILLGRDPCPFVTTYEVFLFAREAKSKYNDSELNELIKDIEHLEEPR